MGVQGHQKSLENSKTVMKIDVFLCLVVQEPGFYRAGSAPPDPPFLVALALKAPEATGGCAPRGGARQPLGVGPNGWVQ